MRGATTYKRLVDYLGTFQSTLPMRGATELAPEYFKTAYISIHAPHAGSDSGPARGKAGNLISIHAPHAGSDRLVSWWRPACGISIHAPHAGSDCPVKGDVADYLISIHAPHAGSDSGLQGFGSGLQNFNPRSPCGERHSPVAHINAAVDFNPRSPCGERHLHQCFFHHIVNFNPRSPCGERRQQPPTGWWLCVDFNPRSPCGERPKAARRNTSRSKFQSTLPMRGATEFEI